jgi:hypothetical protein
MRGIRISIILLLMLGLPFAAASASAPEGKNIVRIGSDVTIEKDQKVRSVVAVGGQVTVSGIVEKSVVAIGGSVVLAKTAVVGGSVTSLGGVIVTARDAEIGGNLTEINSSNLIETLTSAVSSEWEGWSWIFAVVSLSIFLFILVIALLIVALLPKPVRAVSEAITENTFKVILCGLLGLVLIAPLTLLLTISVVGIALIPLQVIFVVCAVLLGFIAAGRLVGRAALRLFRRPEPGMLRETFWGLVLLWMIGWIPYIGWMVKAIAIVLGLGATLVTRFGTHQGWKCIPLPESVTVQPVQAAPPVSAAPTVQAEPPIPMAPSEAPLTHPSGDLGTGTGGAAPPAPQS